MIRPLFVSSTVLLVTSPIALLSAAHPVPFEVQLLTVDANEGCDVADFDGDEKLDVVAGRNWYRNPDWSPRPVRTIEDWNGYVQSNGDFAYDVNGDGRKDVVAGSFVPTTVYWYENPGGEQLEQGLLWAKHLLGDTGHSENEGSFLRDMDGDGTPEWVSDSWNKNNPLVIWTLGVESQDVKVPQRTGSTTQQREMPVLRRNLIGDVGQGHGMAFGDINNDGREDLLVGTGWHERPAGDIYSEPWSFHPDWDLHASVPMLVHDVDVDGINDLLWGQGHDFGLYLWRGRGPDGNGRLQFDQSVIDESFSQPHCLHLADLDGDGRPELITGKRVRAHNGKDPGGTEPPLLCYYTWQPGSLAFEKHIINDGSVGIGLQIRTADLDGDGDVEIIVAGKEGTQIVWNRRK